MAILLLAAVFFGPFVLVTVWARRIASRYEAFLEREVGRYQLGLDEIVGRSPLAVYREQSTLRRSIDDRVAAGEFGPEGQRLLASTRSTVPFSIIGVFAGFPGILIVSWLVGLLERQGGWTLDGASAVVLAPILMAIILVNLWQTATIARRGGSESVARPIMAMLGGVLVLIVVLVVILDGGL